MTDKVLGSRQIRGCGDGTGRPDHPERPRDRRQRALPAPTRIKPPERCPFCNSGRLATKGSRIKKLETVSVYRCRACGRTFTPGPRALRNKTYPLVEIVEAITLYNRGYSLAETSQRLSSRHGHPINPSTISRWIAAHPLLTTYRRLRDRGRKLYDPPRLIRKVKLYHRQVYEFAYHRGKLHFLREGTLDERRLGDTRFAPLGEFLEQVSDRCPHECFRSDDAARCSQIAPAFLQDEHLMVVEKENAATEAAALIIPGVGTNYDRHPKLQAFMLANDSTTIAVEVPIWLLESDIAALEAAYCAEIMQRLPLDPGRPEAGHKPRFITGHIDFLQVRNGAVHILDYKPDARTNRPIAQLAVYALALTRLVPGLRLFDIKCAWFNETCYNEFFPRKLFPQRRWASTEH